ALGMILAQRIQNHQYRCYVLMSDGECEEGSVWEAALFAAAHKMGNVVVMIDYNKWQATGRSNEIMALDPLAEKWRAFDWNAHDIDGNDMAAVMRALRDIPPDADRPTALVGHTIKGKGVSFMEDDNNWHYRIPTAEEVQRAHEELGLT